MKRKTHIKRNREIKACLQCRSSKQGCDHEQPQCSRCRLRRLPCSYAEQSSPSESSTASTRSFKQTGVEDSLERSPSSDALLSTLRIDDNDNRSSIRTLPSVHSVSNRIACLVSANIGSTKNVGHPENAQAAKATENQIMPSLPTAQGTMRSRDPLCPLQEARAALRVFL